MEVDPKTVRKVLRRTPARERARRPSALDPFRPLIRQLVLDKDLSGVRVLEEIRAVGYRGGYTVLKEYIRSFRPKPVVRPHLRFETEPGVQAQVDLSPYVVMLGETATDVVCFSFVLGFSRWQFIRFVESADARSVCQGHVLAFEEAGGVPLEILYDRMKQVVIESRRTEVIFHPLFEALVHHYGFRPVPLAPGYKEGKGKVENPFRYVEGNFLAGRSFHDLADLNQQAARWLREIARVRVHRTTQARPVDRLDQERVRLLPLPERAFDPAVRVTREIGDDFCVAWDTNRYSAPPRLAGRTAWVRVLERQLEIEVDGEVVAVHRVRTGRYQRYVLPEHEEEFRRFSTSRHVLAEQFRRLGAAAEPFARGLIEERAGAAGYHMSRILQLADRVGTARVAEALRHATRYHAFDYQAVARIVAGKPRRLPATEVPKAIGEYLKGAGTHQRTPDAYLSSPPTQELHGDRRERPTDREPPPSVSAPRRPKPR